MEVKNGRKVRNGRNSFVQTSVIGVRGEKSLWDMCDDIAQKNNISRNELILLAIYEYCTKDIKGIENGK